MGPHTREVLFRRALRARSPHPSGQSFRGCMRAETWNEASLIDELKAEMHLAHGSETLRQHMVLPCVGFFLVNTNHIT